MQMEVQGCSAAEKYEKGHSDVRTKNSVRAEHCVVSYGGADLPVTPLPTLMSLCLIESSAGVFIPQSFMSISKVSDLKLCSTIRLHYCFGLLFSSFEVRLRHPSALLFRSPLFPCCAFGWLPESTHSGGSHRLLQLQFFLTISCL
jgi:hypothetical protein